MKKAAIFDIDGTLCEISPERWTFAKEGDWHNFHETASSEFSYTKIVQMAADLQQQGQIIILLTARPIKFKLQTEKWLRKNKIQYGLLLMRPDNNYSRSFEIKEQHLKELLLKYAITIAFDDREQDLALFHRYNIETIKVIKGESHEYRAR